MPDLPDHHNEEETGVRIPVEDPSRFLPWLAVLASQRIPYRVEYQDGKQFLLVADQDVPGVHRELALYEQNTAAWRNLHPGGEGESFAFSQIPFWTALLTFSLLLRFHQLVQQNPPEWQNLGVWDAGLIRAGEYWRCLTALSLHGDYAHLLGNLFWGSMLLTLTAGELGNGWGLLLMLLSGTLGNALNAALLPQAEYQALGASTMVFGLLGILAGRATLKIRRQKQAGRGILQQFRLWLPLLAEFALLALTGTAPGSDLAGHLTGFLCGILLGLLTGRLPPGMSAWPWQLFTGVLAALSLPLAWLLAWKG